jgi:phosphoribosylformylglycinamidine cyclo-ligase
VRIIKDNLFEPPIIFQLIQKASQADDKEMYQVFNMGTRMEIYTNKKDADDIISAAKKFDIDAQIIGRVEQNKKKELVIKIKSGEIVF